MSCGKPYEVVAYLKGELPEAERAPAREHFETCEACKRELAKIDRVLHALGKMQRVEPTPGFRWRVREAFVAAHPEFLERPHPAERHSIWGSIKAQFSFVPAWALSVAAHIMLLTIAAVLFFTPEDPNEKIVGIAIGGLPRKAKDKPAFGPEKPTPWADVTPERPDGVPPALHSRDPRVRPLPEKEVRDWTREKLPNPFASLTAGRTMQKEELRAQHGGEGTAESVGRGLAWLASKQRPDGRWNARELGGLQEYEVGITGLALLAFLGDGHTPDPKSDPYGDAVRRGLNFLLKQQKMQGLIGDERGNYMYNHGIAGLAILEAFIMTRDDALAVPAASAVSFTVRAQNEKGGWDYRFGGQETDTSVGSWQVLLLRLARENGSDDVVPSLILAKERLLDMTDSRGRVGYRARPSDVDSTSMPNGPHALTAIGAFTYLMASSVPEPSLVEKHRSRLQEAIAAHKCTLDGQKTNDLYLWYYGSLALHQAGGPVWGQWNTALKRPLVQAQQKDGSWPANFDRWSTHGGQVYTTAMATLILETYYRYPRLAR